MTGTKDDKGKPRWDLLPWAQLTAVVRVLTKGAEHYGAGNWQTVADARARYFAALMRHLTAWWAGELLDPDDGEPHLAHAVCCVLFLAWFDDLGASLKKAPHRCSTCVYNAPDLCPHDDDFVGKGERRGCSEFWKPAGGGS